MRITDLNLLNEIICDKKIAVYGTGWIAKLLVLYFEKILGHSEIEIIKDEGGIRLHWDCKILDSISREDIPVIVAEKETVGKKIAEELNINNDVFYLSENLKNIIDAQMMMEYPNEYEILVLNGRKEELDSIMTKKIGNMISNIISYEDFPIFDGIEFETINRCNGTCSFCPVNKYDDPRPMKKMSEELFKRLIKELKEMDYRGRVAMYSNNEPFLDSRIIEFTKYARKELPNVFLYIFTNGTLLNVEKFQEIIKYIDFMCLDLYYDDEKELSAPNIVDIIKYCENNNICDKVMIQTINRKAIRNNRGGDSKNRHQVYQPKAPCILPFTQFIVRPDGKVSLCCNDPLGEYTMADLNEVTIKEAWNSELYKAIRDKLKVTRQNITKCATCDNYSTTNQNGNMIFTREQIRDSWEAYHKGINIL